MRKFVFCFIALTSVIIVNAQTLDDIGRICIHASSINDRAISAEAAKILESRIQLFIISSGISDNGIDRRFEMSANIVPLSKDILAGPPARVSQKFDVSFFIRDVIDRKEFGRVSLKAVGIGLNENKSCIAAINSISADNPRVLDMIESAKALIVEYYRTNAERILKDARALADKGRFDEAIYMLSTVPGICEEEYNLCQDAAYAIYRRKINYEGEQLLKRARASWAESPDQEGARKAISDLNKISVLASCNSDVAVFLTEITEKIKEDQKAEWEFQMKQYEDEKAREQRDFEFRVLKYQYSQKKEAELHKEAIEREKRDYEFAMRKYEDEAAYQRAVLDASKEVALAYVKQR
ncbi:MAG: hypothetical protein IKP46_01860 [Bacteroidales bacterium]|nr:hypothetical protein [Bacteroidales bacterium]